MRGPILLDLSHTSHSSARTGVQRVALGLRAALAERGHGITFDPYAGHWRRLDSWEERNLDTSPVPTGKRGNVWPGPAKWRGRMRRAARFFARRDVSLLDVTPGVARSEFASAGGLIVPEIFSAAVGAALPQLLPEVDGPRVAVFHDAIALRLPELSAPATVARFPAYLYELAQFDGIAAVSEASRADLLSYWEWAGIWDPPPVIAVPLGVEPPSARTKRSERSAPQEFEPVGEDGGTSHLATILCVSTIEGRKNHVALLDACETLWRRGLKFELRLIGLAQRQTGTAALALIDRLRGAGRALRYDGIASESALEAAYAAAAFTVYPSLAEGFGLPVAESLVRGKPCVCSAQGALGEVAGGGGCLTVPEPNAEALATACARLIQDSGALAALATEAKKRVFPTPADHARRLIEWMADLKR